MILAEDGRGDESRFGKAGNDLKKGPQRIEKV